MPVNVGLTFLIGGIIGWILVKLLKPNLKVEGLIIAACSSGTYHGKVCSECVKFEGIEKLKVKKLTMYLDLFDECFFFYQEIWGTFLL